MNTDILTSLISNDNIPKELIEAHKKEIESFSKWKGPNFFMKFLYKLTFCKIPKFELFKFYKIGSSNAIYQFFGKRNNKFLFRNTIIFNNCLTIEKKILFKINDIIFVWGKKTKEKEIKIPIIYDDAINLINSNIDDLKEIEI